MVKPRSSGTFHEQEKAREGGAKEISGEEQWRRVGVSGSLRERRSKKLTQSNTSSTWGSEVPLESQRG